ncbi:MAG TPA: cupin domain-containing protein [Gaiellaceae bacterium]|nr:cupin domain-containing protein [Gaiellaceae bacterium]
MSNPEEYFAGANPRSEQKGLWVRWADLDPLEMVPGLTFQPVLGERLMVNFVTFEPHTEAPVHWHDEEQITYVMDGEFEFEVAGEVRTLRRGDAVVIPPNVPHGARTRESGCVEIDVFHPPRQGVLDAMRARDEG